VTSKLEGNLKECRQDFIYVAILMAIALTIGIYLVVTTVMISKDGVFYIELAQELTTEPAKITKAHPPGYLFLILMSHKFVNLFTDNSSNLIWIYSAQSITLLCRLLAIIPLYFIGKLLVGSRNSFLALFILTILPYPARFGCDVVREWPYLLFLATGFLFLFRGIKYGKWWVFGIVGLSSGFGYLIRYESAQLVLYGFLWVAMSMFRPKVWDVSRWKSFFAVALLLIGFSIPAAPHMKCTGKIIPRRVNHIIKSFSFNVFPDKTEEPNVNIVSSNYNTAEMVPYEVLKSLGEIFKTVGENLIWFFMPPLMLGLYYRFRGNVKSQEWFLITVFVLVNVTIITLRYCYIESAVSKRWSLPLITFTIFYVPVGLHTIGDWLNKKQSHLEQKSDLKGGHLSWFVILFLIGIGICMPKLLRPVRIEKQGYRDAAKWLRGNTAPTDIIAVSDRRLYFYAERKGVICDEEFPKVAGYFVRIRKIEDEEVNPGITAREEYSVWVNKQEKEKLIIYKMY